MQLIHNAKGVSKLIFVVLLLIDFVLGAFLSYIWTMSYYAPQAFHLPSQANVTIERVEFNTENVTFFDATFLNPSYSPSPVTIEQILMATGDGVLLNATTTEPALPQQLDPGSSQAYRVFLNWGNYTGQTVNVIAFVSNGTGPTLQVLVP